jgi:hypothetical protein
MTALPVIEAILTRSTPAARYVVFDIDNTVADTRYRTLRVARDFDALHGSAHFHGLELAQVGLDGRSTALALGLAEPVISAFEAYWCSDRGFWCGDCFEADRPLQPVASIARRAAAVGCEVVWLTGRVASLREPTLRWLSSHALPARALVCKPDLTVRTASFKASYFATHPQLGRVGFFMTESARDIAAVQAAAPALPCVWVDFPCRDAERVDLGVPVLSVIDDSAPA